MNKDTRVTPTNYLRETLVRLANDTEWGQRLARRFVCTFIVPVITMDLT